MADQEKRAKIAKGLENIVSDMQEEIDEWRDYSDSELSHGVTCDCEWWYNTAQMLKEMLKDALALLKAQEPVEPTIGGDADGPCGNWWYQCGKCKEAIDYHDSYCRNCGQAVKWE